jgi:transposase
MATPPVRNVGAQRAAGTMVIPGGIIQRGAHFLAASDEDSLDGPVLGQRGTPIGQGCAEAVAVAVHPHALAILSPGQVGGRVAGVQPRQGSALARVALAHHLRQLMSTDPLPHRAQPAAGLHRCQLQLEGLRDLVRAREDLRGDLMGARHRIGKLLLRRGLLWEGPGDASSQRHLRWLGTIRFDDGLVELVFGEYLAHHEILLARRDRLDAILLEQSTQGSWAPTVARLRCMRDIDTLTAVGLIAEIGAITAFKHPKQLASYLGLVPSEHTSETKRRQGAITKAGSSHARRLWSRLPGITGAHRAPLRRSGGVRPASRRTRSTQPGALSYVCIGVGRTSTQRAPRSAPPSLSPSRVSWRASSGRSHDNPTDRDQIIPFRGAGGGRRRVTRDPR